MAGTTFINHLAVLSIPPANAIPSIIDRDDPNSGIEYARPVRLSSPDKSYCRLEYVGSILLGSNNIFPFKATSICAF
jgi:hypothetical protein